MGVELELTAHELVVSCRDASDRVGGINLRSSQEVLPIDDVVTVLD